MYFVFGTCKLFLLFYGEVGGGGERVHFKGSSSVITIFDDIY